MVQEGAVRFLVQVCAKLESSVPLAHAALALAHMALDEASPSKFIEENAVSCLVELLQRSSDTVWYDVQQNAALAIGNLATHVESTVHLLERGAIPPLVKLCASSEQPEVIAAVTGALASFAKHEGTRAQLLQEGAVKPLVMLCRVSHATALNEGSGDGDGDPSRASTQLPVLRNACRALCNCRATR